MDVLSNYYEESVRDWSIKSGYSKNDPIRQKAFDTFKSYHPKVEAFTDEEMTALFMFMIYQTSKGLVFTQVERAF